jgi:hypothetical protein
MPWHDIAPFALDKVFGYQSANRLRECLIAAMARSRGRYMGGTRGMPNHPGFDPVAGRLRSQYPEGLGPFSVENWLDVELDGDALAGLTVQVRVGVRTADPTVSITPKVWNVTDGVDVVVGETCIMGLPDFGGSAQTQILAVPLARGVKSYRLMYTLTGVPPLTVDTWCIGEMEIFANVPMPADGPPIPEVPEVPEVPVIPEPVPFPLPIPMPTETFEVIPGIPPGGVAQFPLPSPFPDPGPPPGQPGAPVVGIFQPPEPVNPNPPPGLGTPAMPVLDVIPLDLNNLPPVPPPVDPGQPIPPSTSTGPLFDPRPESQRGDPEP